MSGFPSKIAIWLWLNFLSSRHNFLGLGHWARLAPSFWTVQLLKESLRKKNYTRQFHDRRFKQPWSYSSNPGNVIYTICSIYVLCYVWTNIFLKHTRYYKQILYEYTYGPFFQSAENSWSKSRVFLLQWGMAAISFAVTVYSWPTKLSQIRKC